MLVKLQRPPPEIRIFFPGRSAWSISTTRRPRRPASIAHIMPAAPAPSTNTSTFCTAPRTSSSVSHLCDHEPMANRPATRASRPADKARPARKSEPAREARPAREAAKAGEAAPAKTPRIAEGRPDAPVAVITRRAADRLRAGHLWVYRSDIEALTPAAGTSEVAPGALVTLTDSRNIPLGTAVYSTASEIAARLISREPMQTREQYLQQVRTRLNAALFLREALAPASAENNAARLVFSEADALPGIIADRYNSLVILQLLTQGTAQDDVRRTFTEVIRERFQAVAGALTIIERPDPRIRELEQLAAPSSEPLFSANPTPELTTIFTINDLRFHYDATAGQKTGAFLDQRLNYAAAAAHAHGTALDICTYQGG